MRVPLSLRLKVVAGRYLPFLKIAPPIDREAVFRLRPIRNSSIDWEAGDAGEALLRVPVKKTGAAKALSFWFRLPETRAVQLDEVGSYVWQLCDGTLTVDGIVRQTSKEYRMNRREVEISVTTFLQTLAERRFIGFYQREGKAK